MKRTDRKGIACPACQSRAIRVTRTRHGKAAIWRIRECRECRWRIKTREELLDPDPRRALPSGPQAAPNAISAKSDN